MLSKKIKLVLGLFLSVYGREALAQISPGYVQQETIKLPGKTTDAQVDALSVTDKLVTRTYIDGMGRTLQQVAVQASPLQNDIIQPVVYDNLGRQTVGYLPYAGKSTDIDGSYRANAITDQAAFYNNGTGDKVADDSSPYSQQVFENSPLQRLLTAGMAGTGFQPTVAGNHYKTVKYRYNNTTTDGNILTWNADGTFTAGTYYADNTLSVTDGIDEDNVETLSYADIAGHTILKRQILSGGNLDTYYIYNLAGAISYVVPPKATTLLSANSYNLSVAPLSNLVFKYLYDARGRIIEKTVPAKGKMVIIYDPLNRPVLLQDAAMATANKWNYIKYDSKNRSISQGIYVDNTNIGRANMQTYVSGLSVYNTAWYENRSATLTNGGYYTNSSFPSTGITPLAYAYFDNYDLNQDGTADFSYSAQGLSGEGSATTAPLKGVPTIISQTTVGAGLTNTWLTKVTFYDKRGNTIQVKSNNQVYYTGGTTLTDTKTVVPDFTGAPQVSLVIKKSSATATLTVQTTLSYDHMKRVTAVDQRYNGAAPVRVTAYTYNELGQVIDKNLGSTNVGNTAWLQSVDMRYNIHGQLLSINNSKLSNDGVKNDDSNDLFGMEMLYDQADANVGNAVRYNGNLSAVKWMTKNGSGVSTYERSYKYSYDAVNRYTGASYAERTTAGTGVFNNNIGGFNEAVGSYDAGGNILTLTRNSSTQGTNSNIQVDNLVYTYDTANPNQLKTVTDGTGTNYTGFGFRNLTGTTTGNYTYDVNGNLTADPYKGLTINYNVLNRTDKITVTTSTGRYINYTYDAGGTLIRKQAYDNNVLGTTTDYVDGFVYLNGVISYFAMPEGRVRNIGSGTTVTLKQEFIVTDQQGNARISFEDNGSAVAVVRQENSYYGFGLTLANSPVATPVTDNKQLYNGGSEWQNDYGNLPDLQQTFYRNYDAALGRWIAVDPVAESAESMTVYQYAGNNPIMLNDPLGDKLPAEGSGITLDWTTNATPYVPHRSLFGSGIDPTILQAGEMYVSGNGYGDYSALWVNIFKASGYNVDKNGIATISNPDPKLSVDYYVDAEGKLIAKSSYDGGRGGAHYYGVTVTGTDHGKAKYVVNDEISYDEVGVRRLTANAQKWLADYHEFQQSFSNGVSNAWNSEFMRNVIPDMINFNVNYSLVFFGGDGYSHEAHWVMRGPDAGVYSSWTHSEKRVGMFFDLSAGISGSYYRGSIDQIKYSDYLGAAKEMGGKFLGGLSFSLSHDGYTPTWGTVGVSAGLSAGGYVGTSTTYPLFK